MFNQKNCERTAKWNVCAARRPRTGRLRQRNRLRRGLTPASNINWPTWAGSIVGRVGSYKKIFETPVNTSNHGVNSFYVDPY